jgi:hypothetical protein
MIKGRDFLLEKRFQRKIFCLKRLPDVARTKKSRGDESLDVLHATSRTEEEHFLDLQYPPGQGCQIFSVPRQDVTRQNVAFITFTKMSRDKTTSRDKTSRDVLVKMKMT